MTGTFNLGWLIGHINLPFGKSKRCPSPSQPHHTADIDPLHLNQHLLRDMGFLDGNDPRGRRR